MEFFPSRTTFVSFGGLTIQWYAVLILTGAFLALYFSKRNIKTYRNIDVNDFMDDIFIYLLWGGIIGARLWYVIFDANYDYLANPIQIIRIWDGGVAIHGALFGGGLVAYLFCRKNRVSFLKFADSVFPTILLAQAIGRWGNFINKECYGQVVEESYYDGILSFLKSGMLIHGEYHEPMFFYESLLCFLGFILINFVLRKYQNKRGDLVWAYLMWYGVIRFFIEGHRTDSLLMNVTGLKTAQVTSIIYLIVGLLGYFGIIDKLFKKKKPTLLFDLDGTLQNSEPAIIKSFEKIFEAHSDPKIFDEKVRAEVLGPSLKDMFTKYFPNEDFETLYEEYHGYNQALLKETLEPMPHAMEMLKALKEEGYNIGIVTTRALDSTEECLKIMGMDQYIDDYVGWREVKNVKPDPEGYFILLNRNHWNKDDIVVIGDSIADINGGKNLGAYTIAYLSNEAKKEELLASNANENITDLMEILDILKKKQYFTYNLK